MTNQENLCLELHHDAWMDLLTATLPDGSGYGRQQIDTAINVDDIHHKPILRSGMPTRGHEKLVAALSETAMTMEIHRWQGLATEPTASVTLWASRYGIIEAATDPSGLIDLGLKPGGSIYKTVAQATRVGPRAPVEKPGGLPLTSKFLANLFPGADAHIRRSALNQLAELTTPLMPAVSRDLTRGQVSFLSLDIQLFCESGFRENALACMDTPSGFLIPLNTGGIFSRNKIELTAMPPWAVWQNILELMPNGALTI